LETCYTATLLINLRQETVSKKSTSPLKKSNTS
ncbi:unnamed protein product, partial [Allacma fusca]